MWYVIRLNRSTIFFGALGLLLVILIVALSVAVYKGTPPELKALPGDITGPDGMPALGVSAPGKDPIIGKWIAPVVGFTLTFDDTHYTLDMGTGYPMHIPYYKKEVYLFTGSPPSWTLTTAYVDYGDDNHIWFVVGDRLYDAYMATNCYDPSISYLSRAG